jgi:RHH-type proline utilization regulon transcriptional repressor/proline dehydrogenase/delta 1-pyrroline-5-carboxylate dehydrogenase
LSKAGVPPGVVNFLPGLGEDVGARLVSHPGVDFIAFTGSRAVGLQDLGGRRRTQPGQANLKKVVCEMGGKNALIIDNDADLDEAIPAALYSAFGYSGQKCSALSRLIILDGVHDRFVERSSPRARRCPSATPPSPGRWSARSSTPRPATGSSG